MRFDPRAEVGRQAGLTLVELLVAIGILAIVAVLGWRGLDGIVRARIALASDLEQTRGMQLAFAQLQSDCAHLVSVSRIPNRAPLGVEGERLSMVRTVFADGQPSRLQVVTYRVRDGVLTRRESAATRDLNDLDAWWLAAAEDAGMSGAVQLQTNVTSMVLRLWDGTAWRSAGDALKPPAQSGVATSPPQLTGLEVTMQLRGHDAGMLKVFLLGAV
jgi:general secretion pathway protein J